MRIGTASERLCGVHSALAMHVIQVLGFQVVRLEVVIGNGPSRRYAAVVLYLSKVLRPQPEESRTVKLCVSTYVVVGVRMEWFAGFVSPDLLRLILPLDVDSAGIPVGFFARDIVAPLEQQDSLAQRRQSVSQRTAACASANDDDVELVVSRHSSPLKESNQTRLGKCLLLPGRLGCAGFLAQLHLRPLLARDCRRAQDHEVNEILGEIEVEYPIQSNTDLLFQAGQLAQVDRPPEEPGDKSREVDTQDVGNASSSPDSRKQPNGREVKGFFGPTMERRQNISRESFPLTHGVLRRGRVGFAGSAVGYDGAVTNSPDTRPAGDLHIFIDDHSASLFLAGECFQDRTGRCPGRPYQSFGINKRAVAQRLHRESFLFQSGETVKV